MGLLCACFSRRRTDHAAQLYQEQFERIKRVYPGTNYVCLLNSENGDMMYVHCCLFVAIRLLLRSACTAERIDARGGDCWRSILTSLL